MTTEAGPRAPRDPTVAPPRAVVVAVAAGGSEAALAFAADRARRRRLPLHVVHVVTPRPKSAYAAAHVDVTAEGRDLLGRCRDRAAVLAGPRIAVTTSLLESDGVVDGLLGCAGRSALLVMQHGVVGQTRRAITGSVVHTVVGRAVGPVVSVPEGWQRPDPPGGAVTVGVARPADLGSVLRTATEEAVRAGVDLRVLHAWWVDSELAPSPDVAAVDEAYRARVASRVRYRLARPLAEVMVANPGLRVEVEVHHSPTVRALRSVASRSSLVVIGRRRHLLPHGGHLGRVARGVLEHVACPTLVASPSPDPEPPWLRRWST